jgi:NAD(P)H-hydrate epimerase
LNHEAIFFTEDGIPVPALTENQMREVDRIAMREFGLGVLQMMENAGRILAMHALDMSQGREGPIVILAGPGGNGGGGLCCARHLHNRGIDVTLFLSKDPEELGTAASSQFTVLSRAGIAPWSHRQAEQAIRTSGVVVDALIGYSLEAAPHGKAADLITICNQQAWRVLSLDLPSGITATSGEAPGVYVRAERVLTLALPKTGLQYVEADLSLADIGIPPEVYRSIGIEFAPLFGTESWVRLEKLDSEKDPKEEYFGPALDSEEDSEKETKEKYFGPDFGFEEDSTEESSGPDLDSEDDSRGEYFGPDLDDMS